LLLYGINEQALSRPLADLHERYDGGLDQIGPYARHIEEGGVLEPLMHVRVRVQLEHMDAVRRELLMRDGRILEQDVVALSYQLPREGVLRARAPMDRLIGFPAVLQAIAGDTAEPLIALDCYEPVPLDLN
jgi:translation elongation factor EF-G